MRKIDEVMHYSYPEIETFGQLLISLPGICRWEDIGDVSSAEVIQRLIEIAVDFTKEWDKAPYEEHDVLGEDYIEEVDKLADWIKKHAFDVFNNSLEYGGYRARRKMYAVEFGAEPKRRLSTKRHETVVGATREMLERITSIVTTDKDRTGIQYISNDASNELLPTCNVFAYGISERYAVRPVVCEVREETDENVQD